MYLIYEPHHEKTCLCHMRKKKDADQPAHPQSDQQQRRRSTCRSLTNNKGADQPAAV